MSYAAIRESQQERADRRDTERNGQARLVAVGTPTQHERVVDGNGAAQIQCTVPIHNGWLRPISDVSLAGSVEPSDPGGLVLAVEASQGGAERILPGAEPDIPVWFTFSADRASGSRPRSSSPMPTDSAGASARTMSLSR